MPLPGLSDRRKYYVLGWSLQLSVVYVTKLVDMIFESSFDINLHKVYGAINVWDLKVQGYSAPKYVAKIYLSPISQKLSNKFNHIQQAHIAVTDYCGQNNSDAKGQ